MKISSAIIVGVCMSIVGLATAGTAMAAEGKGTLRVISSMATRPVLTELFGQFTKETGIAVELESVGGVTAAKRVEAGEQFDLVILASGALDKLVESGKVRQGTKKDLVKSGVAVAVRKGAAKSDVSSEEALKQAVLKAKTVGYSTGPSGTHLTNLFARWGIADQIKDRLVQPAPGIPVGSLVAKGEVELGFQQLSELLHVEGIEILGPLPAEVQILTIFSAGMGVGTQNETAASRLLDFLVSPHSAAAKIKNGMEPI